MIELTNSHNNKTVLINRHHIVSVEDEGKHRNLWLSNGFAIHIVESLETIKDLIGIVA